MWMGAGTQAGGRTAQRLLRDLSVWGLHRGTQQPRRKDGLVKRTTPEAVVSLMSPRVSIFGSSNIPVRCLRF
jgi:hypothetical protein